MDEKPTKKFTERIKSILDLNGTCNANDNISDNLSSSEIDIMQESLESLFEQFIDILLIDKNDTNVKDTPKRLAKMYVREVLKGRYEPMPKLTTFPNTKKIDELFTVGPITVRSCCSHHFVPFIGKVWIGIIPNEKLLGLSKFARLSEWVMARPQIQEEAVDMLANIIEKEVQPKGLAIVMQAKHYCMCWRGVKDNECEMTSSVIRGLLRDHDARTEFFNLIRMHGA